MTACDGHCWMKICHKSVTTLEFPLLGRFGGSTGGLRRLEAALGACTNPKCLPSRWGVCRGPKPTEDSPKWLMVDGQMGMSHQRCLKKGRENQKVASANLESEPILVKHHPLYKTPPTHRKVSIQVFVSHI